MGMAFLTNRSSALAGTPESVSGVSLNFEVVGGTTLPANPKANTIWVNTDATITGWTLQPKEPSIATEGTVWVETYNAGGVGFNALTENGLFVYPLAAKQYLAGEWVSKTCWIYNADEWTELYADVVIFQDGVENTALTGGWTTAGTVGVSADTLQLEFRGVGITAASNNKIDLRGFSKLVFIARNRAGDASMFGVGLSSTVFTASMNLGRSMSSLSTYSLDVSSLNSEAGYHLLVKSTSATHETAASAIILYK